MGINGREELITVDYCKEAMELQISKLSSDDIDRLVEQLAKLINNGITDLDIIMNKADEKNNIKRVKVPIISFLRTDIIKNALIALGIKRKQITEYIDHYNSKPKSNEDTRPLDIIEIKRFIYDALKEKYGSAVVSNMYDATVVVNTKHNNNDSVMISLDYLN